MFVSCIVVAGVVKLVLLEQVRGIGGMGLRCNLLVLQKESGALLGSTQKLVWIPGDRISSS